MNWKIILSLLIGLICFIGAIVRAEDKMIDQRVIMTEESSINCNSKELQLLSR